jgi:hypothetical protein
MDMSEVEGINMLDVDERPLNQRPDVEGIDGGYPYDGGGGYGYEGYPYDGGEENGYGVRAPVKAATRGGGY